MDRSATRSGADVTLVLSIVVPVRDEAGNVVPLFEALAAAVHVPSEVLLVYDSEEDSTLPMAREYADRLPFPLRLVRNDLGRGPANALRAGFAAAQTEAVVVTMADLSDDLTIVDAMVQRFRDGYDVVCPSRYMRGGRQVGGPWLKRVLSRTAGVSLHVLTGLPTRDPTNSFKLYRTEMLRSLDLESRLGFELSLEVTVKAWKSGYRITELPTCWRDRTAGQSKFRLLKWLPRYLHWYVAAFSRSQRTNATRAML